jgi:glucose-1-phosphate cytidylyltransferase
MKVVILSNKTSMHGKLSPMLEINKNPIIYYVVLHFIENGYNDIILTVPDNDSKIREYLKELSISRGIMLIDEQNLYFEKEESTARILLVNRNYNEETAKTLEFVSKYIGESAFVFTYGDILPSVDIEKTLKFHRESGNIATICAYQAFNSDGFVNLGTIILENEALDYISESDSDFERDSLPKIAEDAELEIFYLTSL